MAFFEDLFLTDSIEIQTTPEKIFKFITSIKDDPIYRAWHNDDHIAFRWISEAPWTEGAIIYAEEYFHGKLHKFKFEVTQIEINKKIVYSPVSSLIRFFFPMKDFGFPLKPRRDLRQDRGGGKIGLWQLHLPSK